MRQLYEYLEVQYRTYGLEDFIALRLPAYSHLVLFGGRALISCPLRS